MAQKDQKKTIAGVDGVENFFFVRILPVFEDFFQLDKQQLFNSVK
jgi:hypothetical protein